MVSLQHNGLNGILADEMVWPQHGFRVSSYDLSFLGLGQNTANDFILVVFETLQGQPRPSFDCRPKINASKLGEGIR